jgi:hypothetical protein
MRNHGRTYVVVGAILFGATIWGMAEWSFGRRHPRPPPKGSRRPDVDELDAMLSLWFKTAPDGRKVYFPWRSTGHGYTIASEHDYRRLHQQLKVIWVSVPILGYLLVLLASAAFSSGSALLKGYVILALPIVLVFFPLLFYVWLGYWRYWLRCLQPSDEKYKYERMSRQKVMNFVARLYPSGALWLMEIVRARVCKSWDRRLHCQPWKAPARSDRPFWIRRSLFCIHAGSATTRPVRT